MSRIKVLAAGSLRVVWPTLISAFERESGVTVTTDFGPAGLLLQRIEQGERCDLFASANSAHPQSLVNKGSALDIGLFTHNKLCLSVTTKLAAEGRDWLDLLLDPTLRLATSTPLSDPSGDYTWQLFERIEATHPGKGNALKKRAMTLVGGPQSAAIPPGELAASWLLSSGQAEMFIGYQSYAPLLKAGGEVVTIAIPAPWQIKAEYGFALCQESARPLAAFLLSAKAKQIFKAAGFCSE
ncbi:substrate-binding domain-containing protein [Erwinia sp.]|uniref:substrate-binding domain-containing protein n=1 Tax=Erwinia citreus TaxID=558 RepID=UPI003C77DD24